MAEEVRKKYCRSQYTNCNLHQERNRTLKSLLLLLLFCSCCGLGLVGWLLVGAKEVQITGCKLKWRHISSGSVEEEEEEEETQLGIIIRSLKIDSKAPLSTNSLVYSLKCCNEKLRKNTPKLLPINLTIQRTRHNPLNFYFDVDAFSQQRRHPSFVRNQPPSAPVIYPSYTHYRGINTPKR